MLRVSLGMISLGFALSVVGQAPEFKPRTVVNRVFDAITEIPLVPAKGSDLADNELVLGVVIEGVSRAYPINMLTGPSREILNDSLGGRSIAATW
jgi:hypothetical protein